MTEKKQAEIESEWSHNVKVDEITEKPLNLTITPGDAERTRLIRRLGLLALDDCEAEITLRRESGHIIHVKGRIRASVRQSCVVTLEPVQGQVDEPFEAWYADPEEVISLQKARREREVAKAGQGERAMLEERDDPEAVVNGKIDLGELASQYLSLGIDPYPHAPGAMVPETEEDPAERAVYQDEEPISRNPFAALKDWKDKLK